MKESRFDPAGDLMIVHARLWGRVAAHPTAERLTDLYVPLADG